MKILVLVISCQPNRPTRQRAILETWGSAIPQSILFLLAEGGHSGDQLSGTRLELTVPDAYDDLAAKTWQALCFCHRTLEWDGVLKCDDDTFVHLERMAAAAPFFGDYQGCPLPGSDGSDGKPAYAQGGAYWLSRRAVGEMVQGSFLDHASRPWFKGNTRMRKLGERHYREQTSIEDMMVGDLLQRAGLRLVPDDRFALAPFPSVFEREELLTTHYVRERGMRLTWLQRKWLPHPILRFPARLFRWFPGVGTPR
ncbi:MAG: hypothetical protein JJT96_09545 [Opitutales bacterium]|nr:hypothetical protein [Opitutales bacterium]